MTSARSYLRFLIKQGYTQLFELPHRIILSFTITSPRAIFHPPNKANFAKLVVIKSLGFDRRYVRDPNAIWADLHKIRQPWSPNHSMSLFSPVYRTNEWAEDQALPSPYSETFKGIDLSDSLETFQLNSRLSYTRKPKVIVFLHAYMRSWKWRGSSWII